MISLILSAFEWLFFAFSIACTIGILLKCIWNMALPYAMVFDKRGRGWSIFPFIEFILFIPAALFLKISGDVSVVPLKSFILFNLSLILFNYLHFALVLPIFGIVYRRMRLNEGSDHWLVKMGEKEKSNEAS